MTSIIFDLYGTLLDILTHEELPSFWKKVSKKFHKYKEYSPEQLRREYKQICVELQKEREEIELLDTFKTLYPLADPMDVAITFRKLSLDYLRPYKGVKKLLKQLHEENMRIYLLSNAQAVFTRWELNMFGLEPYFDGICISSDFGVKKPNPVFFQKMIEKYEIDVSNAIMIGNEYKKDIEPAKALGLKTIYIETKHSPFTNVEDKIIGFSYQEVYDRIHELLKK